MPQRARVQAQPLIAVRSVRASSRWYQLLLGLDSLPDHPHRDFYDRMLIDGQLILQLHAWDVEEHPNLVDPNAGAAGHGVLIWFEVDNFREVMKRVRDLGAEIVQEPAVNSNSGQPEIWLRDPDGYVVVVAGHEGESCS